MQNNSYRRRSLRSWLRRTRVLPVLMGVGASIIPASTSLSEHHVIISEVMYNPASNERSGRSEWIEIVNVGSTDADLRGWRIRDEDRTTWGLFDCHLPSGGVAILVNESFVTQESFRQAWSDPNDASPGEDDYQIIPVKWGALSNAPNATDEQLELVDQSQTVVCSVNLCCDDDWPRSSGRGGSSVFLATLPEAVRIWLARGPRASGSNAVSLNSGKVWQLSKVGVGGSWQSRPAGVFEGEDVGSPGVVPWQRPANDSNDSERGLTSDEQSDSGGDRIIDYQSPAGGPDSTAAPTDPSMEPLHEQPAQPPS